MSPEVSMVIPGSVWRHKVTGHVYTVVGSYRDERSWEPAVLYVRLNPGPDDLTEPVGRVLSEFVDGRFEPIERVYAWAHG